MVEKAIIHFRILIYNDIITVDEEEPFKDETFSVAASGFHGEETGQNVLLTPMQPPVDSQHQEQPVDEETGQELLVQVDLNLMLNAMLNYV